MFFIGVWHGCVKFSGWNLSETPSVQGYLSALLQKFQARPAWRCLPTGYIFSFSLVLEKSPVLQAPDLVHWTVLNGEVLKVKRNNPCVKFRPLFTAVETQELHLKWFPVLG